MITDLMRRATSRRGLFKLGGLASLPLIGRVLAPKSARAADPKEPEDCAAWAQRAREQWWKEDGKYFVQDTVDMSEVHQGFISARVDGRWQRFRIRHLDEGFIEWNFSKRAAMLENMMGGQLDMYNDIHNAAVASYGMVRGDSQFSLNVAYKGTGWVPKQEFIKDMTDEYWNFKARPMGMKLAIIENNYADRNLWRTDIIGSLELYTSKAFETHTFLNQMVNPVSVICFHDFISYEVRTIARLIHPSDPNLTAEEADIALWINYAHDFFHGQGTLYDDRIGVIYYVVEEFDNSPYGQTELAGGHRVVPPM